MPMYDIEHIVPLTDAQQDKIAEAITKIHSEKFVTARLFVNVNFKDISTMNTYVAGKRRPNNRIFANVRHGPSRTQEMYDALCADIESLWAEVVGSEGKQELRGVFVLGSIVAGSEGGFSVPKAGQDEEWLEKNVLAFKKKADSGDTDFQGLLEDLRSRAVFNGILDRAGVNGAN
ncbi:hypothetical protein NA57DRAFT_64081 [Rhizodiscina lignyota]|uniref:Tautomerase cis-CaaD-like domain-containing protein n=1 Tax=Rhizodiscina lignyota TaxID=1504668 RepID=A0A9P4IKY2_9PEZI|nr:hypothetical protein NA57DRAFT_64081 [Rhizodiscina lignyota]